MPFHLFLCIQLTDLLLNIIIDLRSMHFLLSPPYCCCHDLVVSGPSNPSVISGQVRLARLLVS
jgi:hypothetical protein